MVNEFICVLKEELTIVLRLTDVGVNALVEITRRNDRIVVIACIGGGY